METASSTLSLPNNLLLLLFPTSNSIIKHPKPSHFNFNPISITKSRKNKQLITSRIYASVSDVSSIVISTPPQVDITWEIVVGALAGVTPFVVAGIEFSKRIVKQKECQVCRGSGLVLRDNKYYFRCPRCGGFLPWQSWRRFFTG